MFLFSFFWSTFKCEEFWGFFLTSQENLSSRSFILYLLCFIHLESLRASQGLFSVQGCFSLDPFPLLGCPISPSLYCSVVLSM